MKLSGTFSLLLLLAVLLPGGLPAQRWNSPPEITEPGIYHTDETRKVLVLYASDPQIYYANIKSTLMFPVIDRENPCMKDGKVRLVPSGCKVQRKGHSRTSFWVEPFEMEGSIRIYYEYPMRTIDVGKIHFVCKEADTTNADFLRAYGDEWRHKIWDPENYLPDPAKVEKDERYQLDLPGGFIPSFRRGEENRIRAVSNIGPCKPMPMLIVEGDEVEVRKLERWNEFVVVPNGEGDYVDLKCYVEKEGEKELLEILRFGLEDPEE